MVTGLLVGVRKGWRSRWLAVVAVLTLFASAAPAGAQASEQDNGTRETVFTAPGLGRAVAGGRVDLQEPLQIVIAGGDEAVQVYELGVDGWAPTATLTADDGGPGDDFGAAVNLSGVFAVIGAPGADVDGHVDAGAAYVFRRNTDGTWDQITRLVSDSPSTGAHFGASVSAGAQLYYVIGSPGAGRATVFEPVQPGASWRISAELTAPDLTHDEAVAAGFGASASISFGFGLIAVGAPGADSFGAVYAYRLVDTAWVFDEKLVDSPRTVDGRFGEVLSIEATSILIGTPGVNAVVGVLLDPDTGQYTSLGRDVLGPGFGSSVGTGSSRGIAGDPANRVAHVYARSSGGGEIVGTVLPSEGALDDGFGASVDVFRPITLPARSLVVAVGAPGADAIHIFDIDELEVPTVIPGGVTVAEGDDGTTTAQVPVSLTEPSVRTITVDFTTLDHTATTPDDYEPASGTVTFAPGETEALVPVTFNADLLHEADEIFLVSFSNPIGANLGANATIGGFYGLGFVEILNDDPPPVARPWIGLAREGDTGTITLDVPVNLSTPSGLPVTLDWVTEDVTANAPDDYEPASGTVTIDPGDTRGVAMVTIYGDTKKEPPEVFLVSFRNPTGATLGGFYGLGFGVILDDD